MGAEHIGIETSGLSFERDLEAIFARAPVPRRRAWPIASGGALALVAGAAVMFQFAQPEAVSEHAPQIATAPPPVPAEPQIAAPAMLPMSPPVAEIREAAVEPERRVARGARRPAARAEPGLVRQVNATAMYAQAPTTSDREAVVIDEQGDGREQEQSKRDQRDARVAAIDAVRALRLH